jgi:hypothetical protein
MLRVKIIYLNIENSSFEQDIFSLKPFHFIFLTFLLWRFNKVLVIVMENIIIKENRLEKLDEAFRRKNKAQFLKLFNDFLLEPHHNFNTAKDLLIQLVSKTQLENRDERTACIRQWESLDSKITNNRDYAIVGISWFKQIFLLDNLIIFIDELFDHEKNIYSRLYAIYLKREEKIGDLLKEYRSNYQTLKESRFKLFLIPSV